MPKLEKIIHDRDGKKFTKKSYRPWDLTGDGHSPNTQELNDIEILEHSSSSLEEIISLRPSLDILLDNKTDGNQITKEHQKESNKVAVREQLDHKQETNKKTFREQIDINIDPTNLNNQLLKLSGIQKNIFEFIVNICTLRDVLDTGPIETATIAACVKTTTGTVKISLKRLIDKGFILRNKGKQAKGGYIHLSLTQEVYNAAMYLRESKHRPLNPAEILNSIRYHLDNNQAPISSSNYEITTTTKKQETIPDEWQEVNFDSLAEIGFSKTQIKQLTNKNDPQIVQLSIDHFAYGLKNNPKFKKYTDPLNVLMGVLRKGEGWFEQDYKSPQEIALQKLMDNKKSEIERRKKLDIELYTILLNEWIDLLTPEEIKKIAPNERQNGDITPQKAKLSSYFKENVWPTKKSEYLIISD